MLIVAPVAEAWQFTRIREYMPIFSSLHRAVLHHRLSSDGCSLIEMDKRRDGLQETFANPLHRVEVIQGCE
jgi:hypothetical protein